VVFFKYYAVSCDVTLTVFELYVRENRWRTKSREDVAENLMVLGAYEPSGCSVIVETLKRYLPRQSASCEVRIMHDIRWSDAIALVKIVYQRCHGTCG
jgi:hypothetical protein